MKNSAKLLVPIAAGLIYIFTAPGVRAQTGTARNSDQVTNSLPGTVDQAINRLIEREHEEMEIFDHYHPIIETYVQDSKDVRGEPKTWRDWYFLGVADMSGPLDVRSLIFPKDRPRVRSIKSWGVNPAGLLQEIFIDRNGFDLQHYRFHYAGREFLGEIRALMFDVTPLPNTGHGRFKGRIWVEDQDFNVVRFNGAFYPLNELKRYLHILPDQESNAYFDSWRVNVQPGLWVPAYIFSDQTFDKWTVHIQTRLWGYNRHSPDLLSEYANLSIQAPNPPQEATAQARNDRTPLDSERKWRSEAETNALTVLQEAGLVAPAGTVEKFLDTVVNNLEVSNNLNPEPDITCRIVTTSNLEVFSIGHTVILSRGLVDVLPDEPALALVIAQAISRILKNDDTPDRYGFGDILQTSPLGAIRTFRSRENGRQLHETNAYAVSLLKNSPYKDKVGSAQLFLKQLQVQSRTLTELITPNLGDGVLIAEQFVASAPLLQPERLDQIAALPIGGRLTLDPWTDTISFLDAETVRPSSPREKMPFEITPFMPFLTRYKGPESATDSRNKGGS